MATTRATKKTTGPTRILNCVPSEKTDTDWQLHNAQDAGLMAAGARAAPASKDLRDDSWWKIGDQGASGACVGWASGRLGPALAPGAGREAAEEPAAVAAVPLDGREGDRRVRGPADHVHRVRRHHAQGVAGHLPQVGRRPRLGAAVQERPAVRR